MKINTLLILFGLFVGTLGVQAQSAKSDLVKEWERAKAYTAEYLAAMPDDQYAFKPTPEIWSFADQMLHIADANYGFVTSALGAQNPNAGSLMETLTDKTKASTTKAVLASYDFVIEHINKMADAEANDVVKLFGAMDVTKAVALNKLFEHQTHHRGQTTIYLRLAGVVPPAERLF